jgi:(5-formylfuran-3-yl)methyl phosphate synthase
MPRSDAQHDADNRVGLLISVRDADEALLALNGGADFIDIKEPSRGSLGAADPAAVAAIVAAIDARAPISIAAGELLEWSPTTAPALMAALDGIPALVKFGLAGCESVSDLRNCWQFAISQLGDDIRPVAVVYADWHAAAAPSPEEVLAMASDANCPALLIDTWNKSHGTLFAHWPLDQIASFVDEVRKSGMLAVLAGSLDGTCLETALACRPDLIAVRGAVCDHSRAGRILLSRVQSIRAVIEGHTSGDKLLSSSGAFSR